MIITIKKKHLVTIAGLISTGIGGYYLQELWRVISDKSLSILIAPLIFLFTTIYTINYFLRLRQDEKLINDIGKEISKGDSQKLEQLKNHLFNQTYNEAYTLNIFKGIIKLTSSWANQKEIDNLKSRKLPDAITKELMKKIK